jgi:hypothetical protein
VAVTVTYGGIDEVGVAVDIGFGAPVALAGHRSVQPGVLGGSAGPGSSNAGARSKTAGIRRRWQVDAPAASDPAERRPAGAVAVAAVVAA